MPITSLFLFLVPFVMAAVPSAGGPKNQLVSMSAGRVGDTVITTREVMVNSAIEDVLFRGNKERKLQLKGVHERPFVQEVTAVLLETAIAKDAKDLPLAKVTEGEIQKAKDTVIGRNKNQSFWKNLRLSDVEIERILQTKLSAKKFLEFKLSSANLPVSDTEAQAYYKNNRFKFDNASYESLRENIKGYLRKKQVDDRLREWFEVLKIKYSIRNQLAEKAS